MSDIAGGTNDSPFVVSRNIPLKPFEEETLQEAIRNLMERNLIVGARADSPNRLHISYDASCVGIRDIETWLEEAGIFIDHGFSWRLKSSWYAFLDENAKSNARSSGGACCNRPPPGSGDTAK